MDDFPFVRHVVHMDEVDSTSNLARSLVEAGSFPLPALVWADRQTRGRGQGSNLWWSDQGSLTFTLVVDPLASGLNLEQEARVALASAVVVADAVESLIPSCTTGIRWPNDVEFEGRKLGGILPERVTSPDGPRLLVGIGLNVRTRVDQAPTEVARMAATLTDWSTTIEKAELLRAILIRFSPILADLAANNPRLPERWRRLDTLVGSTVRIQVGPELIQGLALGIDDKGGLRVDREGRVVVIHAGRVLREPA